MWWRDSGFHAAESRWTRAVTPAQQPADEKIRSPVRREPLMPEPSWAPTKNTVAPARPRPADDGRATEAVSRFVVSKHEVGQTGLSTGTMMLPSMEGALDSPQKKRRCVPEYSD